MLAVYDRSRKLTGLLQNAFNVHESLRINALDTLSFSLPAYDHKNALCQPLHLVRYDGGALYRIVRVLRDESDEETVTYEAESVIALLLNKSMFGYRVIGNLGVYTRDVLEYILAQQPQRDWTLDKCDFARQFEYGWEQENLYSAMLSVANRFTDKYMFRYDTSVYPFKLSLVRIDMSANPVAYVRRGVNRLALTKDIEYTKIITRLYPLGAGEGINQLGISNINGGRPYLDASPDAMAKYGVVEYIWTDRRYEQAESLLQAAQAMLTELQEPYVEYECDFVGEAGLGDIVEIVGETRNYVVGIDIEHGEQPRKSYQIANKPYDVAAALADAADRQRVEMVYSQGATQIYADSLAENADASYPAELRFYIVENMPIVNAVKCKIRLSQFRAYSRATTSGGSLQTTNAGGGTYASTDAGGGTFTTTGGGGGTFSSTQYGGGTSRSTASGGGQSSGPSSKDTADSSALDLQARTGTPFGSLFAEHYHGVMATTTVHRHGIAHTHTMPTHTHDFSVPDHNHSFTIGDHTHSIQINPHTHSLSIPAHTHSVDTTHDHQITPGIYFFGGANGFTLFINGVDKGYYSQTDVETDITAHLIRDGKIPRGTWHTIAVQPNAQARVEIAYNLQGFIQSRGDYTV